MQTRRLRLGDVVDDYCPRERRLSNHVVVAMVDDAIKQTRCTTCDFEHPYKDGKLPARRKKKDATAALYEQVLEGMTDKPLLAPHIVDPPAAPAAPASVPTTPSADADPDRPKSAHLRSKAKGKTAAPVEATPASAASHAAAPHVAASDAASSSLAGKSSLVKEKTSGAASHGAASHAAASHVAASDAASSSLAGKSSLVKEKTSGAASHVAVPHVAASHAASSRQTGGPRVVSAPSSQSAGASLSNAASNAAAADPAATHAAHAPRLRHAAPAVVESAAPDVEADDDNVGNVAPAGGENEPLHRRTLIRATLPRPEGEVPVRQAPTFTIREAARAPKFRRPFGRNARPQSGQNGVMNGPPGRQGARGPQARGKKGGAQHAQHGAHRFGQSQGQGQGHGQGHGHGHGSGGGHHAKGRQGGQGNKRFK